MIIHRVTHWQIDFFYSEIKFIFSRLSKSEFYIIFLLAMNKYLSTSSKPIMREPLGNKYNEPIWETTRFGDTRWGARPQYNNQFNSDDLDWLTHPLQPPYMETDVPDMTQDPFMYTQLLPNGRRILKPEVAPDPCGYPTAIKYVSFGKPVWRYDRTFPSLTVPQQPCKYRGKTTVPDVACMDQQQLESRDRLNQFREVQLRD
jgi:hypothetical protein